MEKERAGIQSVEVGFSLVEALAQASGPLMLKDVAAAAGMSAAKAHRYLVSFQRIGLVAQDERNSRYDLGPAALKIGLASLARLDPVRLARERIPALLETLNHTLAIAVWGNHGPTIVHWEESAQSVTANLRLGDVMPMLASATGAASVPGCRARRRPRCWSPRSSARARPDARTCPRPRRPWRPCWPRCARGTARVVDTVLPGIVAFCVPVFDASGHIVLGLMTLGSLATFDPDYGGAIDAPLQAAARQLSSDLGWRADPNH
jgi:DNA-binding IclR family transcriptional regulator